MGILRNWYRRYILRRGLIPRPAWTRAVQHLPLLNGLDNRELSRLHELATLFLHEKRFEPVQGLALDTLGQVTIAAQACLPILNLDLDWYRGWTAVIVYPGEFIPRQHEIDEAGVVHVGRDIRSGESWRRGPVILSWSDIETAGQCDGYNVVIHEFTHKLDMLNGEPNGFPPLHGDMDARAWSTAFESAFTDLRQRLDAGEEVPIDPYAAQDPAECFAVFSEYFFERPRLLRTVYPQAYEQLRQFYRQDPSARLSV